jgi:hypothetical protein
VNTERYLYLSKFSLFRPISFFKDYEFCSFLFNYSITNKYFEKLLNRILY